MISRLAVGSGRVFWEVNLKLRGPRSSILHSVQVTADPQLGSALERGCAHLKYFARTICPRSCFSSPSKQKITFKVCHATSIMASQEMYISTLPPKAARTAQAVRTFQTCSWFPSLPRPDLPQDRVFAETSPNRRCAGPLGGNIIEQRGDDARQPGRLRLTAHIRLTLSTFGPISMNHFRNIASSLLASDPFRTSW